MNQALFLNMLKSLSNIDRHNLPELSQPEWLDFRTDAVRFFVFASEAIQTAIFREVMKSQQP
jgi:hypothetical protein